MRSRPRRAAGLTAFTARARALRLAARVHARPVARSGPAFGGHSRLPAAELEEMPALAELCEKTAADTAGFWGELAEGLLATMVQEE